MKKSFASGVILCFLACMFFPLTSKAAKGWLVGAGVGASAIKASGISDSSVGVGSYLDVGYGFNKYFTAGVYVGGDVAPSKSDDEIEDPVVFIIPWAVAYLGAYGRFTFDVGKNLEPYADIGLGAYSAWGPETLGLKFGGGLNWFPGKNSGWFIGPELAFHYIPKYEDSAFEALFKFGYQWRK
jgi:hypothetical protein